MSIENKDDASKLKKINDKPVSMADSLQKTQKDGVVPFTKTKTFYGLLAGFVVVSIVILYAIFFAGGSSQPKAQAIEKPTAEQMAEREAAIAAEEAAAKAAMVDPAITALPADDFVFATEPVSALAMQSTKDIIKDLPEYTDTGAEILTPDGRYLPKNDPMVINAGMETYNMVEGYTLENRLIELRAQDGVEGWFIRSGQGFEDTDYVPIQTAPAADQLRRNMRLYAAEQMRLKLSQAPWQTRQSPINQAANLPPVDNSLTLEERERLLSMVETQRSNNLELVRKNKELREEQQEVKNKVVDLVQRLEDSPKAGARLRATMIPPESGWKVSAIVGDRIYLINKDNLIATVSQGDKLPDSNLIISHADENTGIVLVTPAN